MTKDNTCDPKGDLKAVANFRAGISETNRQKYNDWLDHQLKLGLAPGTIRHGASVLARLDQHLNGAGFEDASNEQLTAFLVAAGRRLTPSSVAIYAIKLGAFYKWSSPRGKLTHSRSLALKVRQTKRLSNAEPITEAERDALLATDPDLRMQALWWTLWDTGFRIGEALSLQVRSVEDDGKGGARLRLPPQTEAAYRLKTGPRTVYVVDCAPALKAWLAIHPQAADPHAPLFPSRQQGNRGRPLSPIAVYNRLKTLTRQTDLRPINPHLFRHTRATRAARNDWSDAKMRAYFGWAANSNMPALYTHLVAQDMEDRVRADANIDPLAALIRQDPTAALSQAVAAAVAETLKQAGIRQA